MVVSANEKNGCGTKGCGYSLLSHMGREIYIRVCVWRGGSKGMCVCERNEGSIRVCVWDGDLRVCIWRGYVYREGDLRVCADRR